MKLKLFKGVKMKADPENSLKNLVILRDWMLKNNDEKKLPLKCKK